LIATGRVSQRAISYLRCPIPNWAATLIASRSRWGCANCPPHDIHLAINMSARSIGYSRWNRTLDRWLKKDATIAERLILEITEHSAMQILEIVVDFIDSLQLEGIAFALD